MKSLPLFDLDEPVQPISPDQGTLLGRDGCVVRVRTGLRAGGGEGGGGTDRSNFLLGGGGSGKR